MSLVRSVKIRIIPESGHFCGSTGFYSILDKLFCCNKPLEYNVFPYRRTGNFFEQTIDLRLIDNKLGTYTVKRQIGVQIGIDILDDVSDAVFRRCYVNIQNRRL